MKFEEYPFDVTRLWDVREPETSEEHPQRLTKQRRPSREPAAEVVPFPRQFASAPDDAGTCRKRTRAELRAIAVSLKARDMLLRSGLADRCAKCARCPDMSG